MAQTLALGPWFQEPQYFPLTALERTECATFLLTTFVCLLWTNETADAQCWAFAMCPELSWGVRLWRTLSRTALTLEGLMMG